MDNTIFVNNSTTHYLGFNIKAYLNSEFKNIRKYFFNSPFYIISIIDILLNKECYDFYKLYNYDYNGFYLYKVNGLFNNSIVFLIKKDKKLVNDEDLERVEHLKKFLCRDNYLSFLKKYIIRNLNEGEIIYNYLEDVVIFYKELDFKGKDDIINFVENIINEHKMILSLRNKI